MTELEKTSNDQLTVYALKHVGFQPVTRECVSEFLRRLTASEKQLADCQARLDGLYEKGSELLSVIENGNSPEVVDLYLATFETALAAVKAEEKEK